MTDHPKHTSKEVLPADTASRLLARASELDAADGGLSVAELRAAAAEANISGRAFDAALAEMRGAEAARVSNAGTRRQRSVRLKTAAAGLVVLVVGGMLAIARMTVLPVAPPAATTPVIAIVNGPTQVLVRSVGEAPVTMGVQREGPLFASLGVAPGADGRRVGHVRLTDDGGTATTPAALRVSSEPGAVVFSAPAGNRELELTVPGTTTQVRGHTVRLVRDRAGGPLRAEVVALSVK
jgi:hypothetical protein